MGTKFESLKNQLRSLEESEFDGGSLQSSRTHQTVHRSKTASVTRYLLFSAFIMAFLFYAGARYSATNVEVTNPVEEFFNWVDQPNEQLLNDMGTWMEEMGYTGLTREDLIELRENGVTATFTSRMRDLGYSDLTLEDLVRLRQNDVSATFSSMMRELGYDLSIEELIRLRQHDVTAYFTSNMHDLGYQNITIDELIRLKDTGVTTSEVERLVEENDDLPAIEDLIRYHISNQ